MKREKRSATGRSFWLCMIIGLGLLLAACGTPGSNTPAPVATTITAPTVVPFTPTTLPPAQPSAPPTSVPTEPSATPTAAAADLPSIACDADTTLTPAQTEGPYYTPNTPERTSLIEPGMGGTKLIVTGYVLTSGCQPVARAWLDFWQADDKGVYDNSGYRLRGHLYTDETGRYTLETILPGEYPGRTQHIHVKVQAPAGPILTTQIYFPNAPGNESDSIFNPALSAQLQDTPAGQVALFNFVVDTK
jgi:protocatechuate 3,4-dioxygenase beta subunit